MGIEAAYRRSAFGVISAFRTVSTDAVVVIAGMMSLQLVVNVERRRRHTRRGTDLSNSVQLVEDAMEKYGSRIGPIPTRDDGSSGSYRA